MLLQWFIGLVIMNDSRLLTADWVNFFVIVLVLDWFQCGKLSTRLLM